MKKYTFTKAGIDSFVGAALDEAMENYPPMVLSVGPHTIEIPMFPETFESMEILLGEALNIYKEEYSGEEANQ